MSRAATALTIAGAGLGIGALYAAPSIVRLLPPRLIPALSGIGDPGHVALTFDDGPDPKSTPAVLDVLDELGWKATFFCLGSMAERAGSLPADIVARGHELGVHGYKHVGAVRRIPTALAAEVVRTRDLLADLSGEVPRWYRPPYGELSMGSFLAARRAGVRLVLWSAWGRDWRAEATPASVVRDVSRGVLAGGTVLLHDSDCTSDPSSWRVTVAALPLLAEHIGPDLRVGPLSQHGLAA